MVVLPREFVAIKYPGYFWNTLNQKLYSIKVTGELKPLAYNKGGWYNGHQVLPGYRVSKNGTRHTIPLDHLIGLKPVSEHEVVGVQA